MNRNLREEALLYGPVIDFFSRLGYQCKREVRIPRSKARLDLLAYKPDFSEIIAVEIKYRDLKRVLTQILLRQFYVDKMYVALPEMHALRFMKRFKDVIRRYGIGILAVNGSKAHELLEAKRLRNIQGLRSKLLETIR